MRYKIELPGFEEQNLQIDVRFPFRPRIFSNKKIMKSNTGKWDELAMRRDDGLTSIVTIHPQFPDPVPQLEMDGETYKAVEPFTLGERLFALIPIILFVFGITDLVRTYNVLGVFDFTLTIYGLVLGLLGIYANFWILRLQERKLERNLMIITIIIAVAVVFFIARFMMIRSQIGV